MERCRRQRGGASHTWVGRQTAIALDMGALRPDGLRVPLSSYSLVPTHPRDIRCRTYRFIFICFTTSPFTIPTISYAARSPLLSPTYHTSIRYTAPILSTLFSILHAHPFTHRTSHCLLWAGALTARSYTIRQMRQVYSMRSETTCVLQISLGPQSSVLTTVQVLVLFVSAF